MSAIYRDDSGNWVQTIVPNWNAIQTVSYDGSVACSVAFPRGCTLVMLWASTNCCFRVAIDPTAAVDSTSIPLTANTYYFLPVGSKGYASGYDGEDRVAFIKQVTAGTAWVVPCV